MRNQLESSLLELAREKPEIRKHLIPLIRSAGIFKGPPAVAEALYQWTTTVTMTHWLALLEKILVRHAQDLEEHPNLKSDSRYLDGKDIPDVLALQKYLKAKTRKARFYKTQATRRFPINLTGWAYTKNGLPRLEEINTKIEQQRRWAEAAIKIAEENYAGALEHWKYLSKGEDPPKNWKYPGEHGSLKGLDTYWDWDKVITWFENGKKPDAPRIRKDMFSDWETPESLRNFYIREPIQQDQPERYLERLGWKDFQATLSFQGHQNFSGQWSKSRRLLQLDAPTLNGDFNVPALKQAFAGLQGLIEHEVAHLGQDLAAALNNLKIDTFGNPPHKTRDPNVKPSGFPRKRKGPGSNKHQVTHDVRDVEFYPNILSAVGDFAAFIQRPEYQNKASTTKGLRWLVKKFLGEPVGGSRVNAFYELRQQAEDPKLKSRSPNKHKRAVAKWRKAVTVFYQEANHRGLLTPQATKVAKRKHYKIDMAHARKHTRRDKADELAKAKDWGWYSYQVLEIVPIKDVKPEKKWNPGRSERLEEALIKDIPLPAIDATPPEGKGKPYLITDGIHRYNLSVDHGFTHIPVLRTVMVETPEMLEIPKAKPQYPVGTWLRFIGQPPRKAAPYVMIEEHLGHMTKHGVPHYRYALAGARKRGNSWVGDFVGDFTDFDLEAMSSYPPVEIRQAVLSYEMWPGGRLQERISSGNCFGSDPIFC